MDLVPLVRQTLRDGRLISAGDTVVCAVSGGPDSMALLHVLHRLSGEFGFALVAAHVHHGFRMAESDAEAETVRAFAASLGVPFRMARVDAPGHAMRHGMNAQAAARQLRYRFLHETAEACGAKVIALAHHLDDQAETVLMNLLSGASLTGLAGMALVRSAGGAKHIRPFLRIRKQDIVDYVAERGIPHHTDSSNLSRDYLRNRLRLDVMPLLLKEQPKLPEALGRLADIAGEEDRFLDGLAEGALKRTARMESGRVEARRGAFLAESVALQRRMIKLILNYLAGNPRFSDYSRIESIRTAIERGSPPSLSMDAGSGIRFVRRYDRLVWEKGPGGDEASPAAYAYTFDPVDGGAGRALAIPGVGVLHAGVGETAQSAGAAGQPAHEVRFDADALRLPLTVRSRRDGDRLQPFGLTGSKKVKDILIDLKIDPDWRNLVPVVTDAEGTLLWIAGIRRSRHAPVNEGTKRVLMLAFEPERSPHGDRMDG